MESVVRSAQEQAKVDQETARMALYHYDTCWFCGRVRATIDRLALNIPLRNIHTDPENHQRLIAEGGSPTVPCLYIDNGTETPTWLYESTEISSYLENQFGRAAG